MKNNKPKQKQGKIIIPPGVFPERHEMETANVFIKTGKNVEFIKPNRTKGAKTSDVIIDNEEWEIKSPKSNGKYTIDHAFRAAIRQSPNIIFDLRRSKMPEDKCLSKLKNEFDKERTAKQLIVVTKSQKTIAFSK
jgi:hypothetical protein